MAKEPKNANVTYFKVDSDGYIYERSPIEKEGFKAYFDRENKLLGYKKIYSATDDGKINFIGVHTADFPTGKVDYVSVSIKNEDNVENIQFQLLNSKGKLSNYAKALAQVLPNINFDETFSLSFDKRKDEQGYTIKNIYFNQADKTDTPAVPIAHKYKNRADDNGGDIPGMEQVEGLGGKVTWDTSKQDNYLYNSMMAQIERFKAHLSGETAQTDTELPKGSKTSSKSSKKTSNDVFADEDEDQDLPF